MGTAGSYRRIWTRQNHFEIIFCKKSGDKKAAIKNGDKKKVTKKTEQQLERILAYMILGQEYKTSELAEVIGVKESRARALVNELVKSGRIKAEGKNKGRRYRLK